MGVATREDQTMKASKVKEPRRCACCGTVYSLEGEAAADHEQETLEAAWECGECGEVYEDRDEAKECCRP